MVLSSGFGVSRSGKSSCSDAVTDVMSFPLLECGLGFIFLMFSLMVVCSTVVRWFTALFSCSVLLLSLGLGAC